jgi:hypothetical protein
VQMPEWTPYRITIPHGSRHRADDGVVLDTVYHVVHVPAVRRILEDGQLRAGLVYDESRLNRSRMCVTWVSANTWGPGSIYGNVQFAFRWSDIIDGRHCYWVEEMPDYSPPAYRLLLTDRNLTGSRYVTPYAPSDDEGPLRERGGVWYWNGEYTSEFMIEGDLLLRDCIGFDFITHRPGICRLYRGGSCPDRRATRSSSGGRVLAFLLGNELHAIDRVLKAPLGSHDRVLSDAVDAGADGIIRALGNGADRFGGAIKAEASRQAVLRGALALYGADQKDSARELIALLNSEKVFEQALEEVVNAHFRTTGWTIPD